MCTEELVTKAMAGEAGAFADLYKAYRPRMIKLCSGILRGGNGSADDIIQDAFVIAFIHLKSLRDPKMFAPWLASITTNLTLKHLRNERKGPDVMPLSALDGCGAEPSAEETPVASVTPEKIQEAIDRLPEGYRTVFRMSVIEGLSHKEIAEMLGIAPHSSSSQLSRAKVMLRKMLADYRILTVIALSLLTVPLYRAFRSGGGREGAEDRTASVKEPSEERKKKDGQEDTDRERVTPPEKYYAARTARQRLPEYVSLTAVDTCAHAQPEDTAAAVRTEQTLTAQDKTATPPALSDSLGPARRLPDVVLHRKDRRRGGRWHLLAAGSLGPALAQNAYKMITATDNDNDMTSSPSPIPREISTWEDYYDYLLTRRHDDMPEDSAALLDIAKSNSGDIIERERHDRPITLGLTVAGRLGGKWSMETGLQYTLLKSSFVTGSGSSHIRETQKLHYVGVPFRLSYRMAEYKRLSVYGSFGVTLNIPVSGRRQRSFVTDSVSLSVDRWNVSAPWQWSVSCGAGAQYGITSGISLYIEPTLNYYIPAGSSTRTIWTEHPFTFSVPLGVRFTW